MCLHIFLHFTLQKIKPLFLGLSLITKQNPKVMIRNILAVLMLLPVVVFSQNQPAKPQNDASAPLHLMQPDYVTPYNVPTAVEITKVLDRVYNYLEATTPTQLIDASGTELSDYTKVNAQTKFKPGDFRLISYEWGVTYAGMLLAAEVTGDKKYAEYSFSRRGGPAGDGEVHSGRCEDATGYRGG